MNMNIKDDVFIHFSSSDRIDNILKDKMLRMNPNGIIKRGIDAITAVSLKYGDYVPSVQTDGLEGDDIKAIIFKTETIPKYGYVEEVIWDKDVVFSAKPKAVSKEQGISLLKQVDSIDDDTQVMYVNK